MQGLFRSGILLQFFAWWLGMLLTVCAQAQPSVDRSSPASKPLRVDVADFRQEPVKGAENGIAASLPPLTATLPAETATGSWQRVALPHVALARTNESTSQWLTSWYRIVLPADGGIGTASANAPWLYLPRWQTIGRVALYADGRMIWHSEGDPVWNGFNQPLLLNLAPYGLDRPREIVLRMDSLAGSGGGIAAPWIGSHSELKWRHAARAILQNWLPPAIGIAFIVLGSFALAVWAARRHESLYLLFFLASLCFGIRCVHYVGAWDNDVMPSAWFGWLTVNSLSGLILAAFFFNIRLCRASLRWLEIPMAGSIAVTALLTLPLWTASQSIAAWAGYSYALTLLIACLAIPVLIWLSFKAKVLSAQYLAILHAFGVPVAVHDLLLQQYRLDLGQPYLMPYWEISFCLVFCSVIVRNHLRGIEGLERSGKQLALALEQKEAELLQSHEQLRIVERREVLARERHRIMRDMHDGLGGTLSSALRMVDVGAGGNPHLRAALQECMDELRIAIHSLTPDEPSVPVLLATLRASLATRLQHAGIRLEWQVTPLPDLPWLEGVGAMHLVRIVQEAIANAVKHSQADVIELTTRQIHDGVSIAVRDNGRGMEQAKRPGGHGLANMRERARILGATVSWTPCHADSTRPGTCFELWLPQEKAHPTAVHVPQTAGNSLVSGDSTAAA